MSATRGQHENRPAGDFYETPAWCTRALIRWLVSWGLGNHSINAPNRILDPGAGTGAITRVLRETWPTAVIQAWDIDVARLDRNEWATDPMYHDFLKLDFGPYQWPFDLCVCNPPYSGPKGEDLALAFIKRAMEISKVGAFLVRLNWIAAAPTKKKQARYEYLKENPPGVLVLGKRPSFTGKGTDATEYCWLILGIEDFQGRWELLDLKEAPCDPKTRP